MTNTIQQKGHQYEYKNINTGLLRVDPLYQRELNQKKVDKIVREWNYDLVNEPKVSMREDGSYYTFNGQHTTAAFKIHEGKDTPIMCKVYRGLTWEEEKDLFIKQNGISSDPTTFEKLRACYNAGDSDVRGMVEAAAKAGVEVTFKTKNVAFGRCNAVSALFTMYKCLSKADFVTALLILTGAWQGQKEGYTEGFIKGMTQVFKKYNGQFTTRDMTKALGRNSPSYYIREAKEMVGSLGTRYEKLFVKEYNYWRHKKLGE